MAIHLRRPKILLAADELGYSAIKIFIRDPFYQGYTLRTEEAIRGTLSQVIANVSDTARFYCKSDFVIIFAGKNDCAQRKLIDVPVLTNLILNLQHTNVIIMGTPFWYNNEDINDYVTINNYYLEKVSENYPLVKFLDVNKYLHSYNGTTFMIRKIYHNSVFRRILYELSMLILKITITNMKAVAEFQN